MGMGWEILIILVIALLVIGPEKMPEVARGTAKMLRQFRRLVNELRDSVNLDDLAGTTTSQQRPTTASTAPAAYRDFAAARTASMADGPTVAPHHEVEPQAIPQTDAPPEPLWMARDFATAAPPPVGSPVRVTDPAEIASWPVPGATLPLAAIQVSVGSVASWADPPDFSRDQLMLLRAGPVPGATLPSVLAATALTLA